MTGSAYCAIMQRLVDDASANCPTGKSSARRAKHVSSPLAKNKSLRRLVETALLIPVSRLNKRGVSRSSRTWSAGCGGRGSVGAPEVIAGRVFVSDRPARRRTALQRTAKSCGPGTRCWCQVSRRRYRPNRASDAPSIREATVAKRNSSPGRSRISRKTIAQGRPDDPAPPVVSTPVLFIAQGAAGARWHPAFPAPSVFGGTSWMRNPGRLAPRECEDVSTSLLSTSLYRQCRFATHWLSLSLDLGKSLKVDYVRYV
jgi:hypothetical protein